MDVLHSCCSCDYSDSSESEDCQGEDIEGVEYSDRSVDGSQFGESLQGFFDDHDSASSMQRPSFYRALDNEDSLSPVKVALGPIGKRNRPLVSRIFRPELMIGSMNSVSSIQSQIGFLFELLLGRSGACCCDATHGLSLLYRTSHLPFSMLFGLLAAVSEAGSFSYHSQQDNTS